ncbi:rRNA maturation RNase YbeY [Roseobacter weihaiensis]|uniref:rRNA maturation RNase YbeY n=1 Tax=Roseobacter weihaiensis TaxID=2763262 RepID=UPI001D09D45D|nr:rRNA maturation RNase YbeY [Roseobacter sp. H9]
MEIDILIEDDRWNSLDFNGLVEKALAASFLHLGIDAEAAEISVLACDDTRIATLNGEFRSKPVATNVLSWPAASLAPDVAGGTPFPVLPGPDGSLALGDIAIAYDTCAREAAELHKSMADHVTHLVVHGTLHLLGYDHVRDPDATLMQRIETEILGKLGLDDPY